MNTLLPRPPRRLTTDNEAALIFQQQSISYGTRARSSRRRLIYRQPQPSLEAPRHTGLYTVSMAITPLLSPRQLFSRLISRWRKFNRRARSIDYQYGCLMIVMRYAMMRVLGEVASRGGDRLQCYFSARDEMKRLTHTLDSFRHAGSTDASI